MAETLSQSGLSRRQLLTLGLGVALTGAVGCNKEEDIPIPDSSGITTINLAEKQAQSPAKKVADRVVAASCTLTAPKGKLSGSVVNVEGKTLILSAAHEVLYSFGAIEDPKKYPSKLVVPCAGVEISYAGGSSKSKDKSAVIAGRYDNMYDNAFITPFITLSSGDALDTRYSTPATMVGDSFMMVGYQGGRDPFKGDLPVALGMICIGEDKKTGNGLLLGGRGVTRQILGETDIPLEGSSGGPIVDMDGFVRGTVAGYEKEGDNVMTPDQIRDRYNVNLVGTTVTNFSVLQFEPLSPTVTALAKTPSC